MQAGGDTGQRTAARPPALRRRRGATAMDLGLEFAWRRCTVLACAEAHLFTCTRPARVRCRQHSAARDECAFEENGTEKVDPGGFRILGACWHNAEAHITVVQPFRS